MRRRSGGRCRALAAAALLVGAAACSGGSGPARWPDVAITDAAGNPQRSSSVIAGGRPAVVAVWATWCAPCKEELPRLQALADAHDDLEVAAVNLGDEPEAVHAFAAEHGLTLPIFIDADGRLSESLGIPSVPATLFVSAGGTIVDRHLGALSADDLTTGAEHLLDPGSG